MSEHRRITLEAIAYGEGATPSERLRALELLALLDEATFDREYDVL